MSFSLGALKDPIDSRDYLFKDTRIAKVANSKISLPEVCNLFMFTPNIKDQQAIGSCVACATASLRELVVKKLDTNSKQEYSALFLYLKARQDMGTFPEDSGLYSRNAMKVLQNIGLPEESVWPYDITQYNTEPSLEIYDRALDKRIYTYHRLETNTIQEMQQCISERNAFVLSMQIFGNLLPLKLSPTGVVQMPNAGEEPVGAHAVLIYGYDSTYKMFYAQNSWGTSYGISGKFWLPFEYVVKYSFDAWTIVS